ncbi:MAG: type II CRISPR RNA-guided endonuclease Cas9 [Lachnospiraceae bacterium]|nr:type II CRISPR RNA-guided endonuclease Cas9 [Lachnospiraceae bacterium]
MKEQKEYYLGLDMGTNSVGWAVTDQEYHLLRAKGKDLWGIREFDEAEVAAKRRSKRISRRRRQREQVRIGLLKEYFADEINKMDPDFYIRMENSKYIYEDGDKDKRLTSNNGVFDDLGFVDKDYYKKYKTIFHLRLELINDPEPHDVRLVYLALLNMFKHRGHFLNATVSSDGESRKLEVAYSELISYLSEYLEIHLPMEVDFGKMEEILSDTGDSRTGKSERIAALCQISKKNKQEYAVIRLICGLKEKASVFNETLIKEDDVDIEFSKEGYDDKADELNTKLGEEFVQAIERMKEIYDIGALAGILRGREYLSEARVADYEKHKEDLRILKKIYKKYSSEEEYNAMFREMKKGTYSAYVNSTNSQKKIRRNIKGRKREDFYKTIKEQLGKWDSADAEIQYVLKEIEVNRFMPKQLTASNGVIPNQVHMKEMRAILHNAEEYLPFLKEKDEYGNSVSERIIQLFSFQIPYYVGPTSKKSSEMNGNGWVVRKPGEEDGLVLPWNINEKIDMKATSEEFIKKMIRKCTYISGEKVMPKNSLKYQKYCVLNELNNIRIKDVRIPVDLKQDIYNDLFKKGKRVTRNQLIRYLINRGIMEDESQLSGIDITINSSLSTYGKFRTVFEGHIDEDPYIEIVENIVYWSTIYGEARNILKEKLEESYGMTSDSSIKLTDSQIKRILGFKFKDWGRLSKAFLDMKGQDKESGEDITLIRAMWDYNLNLMELIKSEQFTFRECIENQYDNSMKALTEFQFEDLEEFYFFAPVKRMVWQTLLIIKELQQILSAPPKRIFIEMSRETLIN